MKITNKQVTVFVFAVVVSLAFVVLVGCKKDEPTTLDDAVKTVTEAAETVEQTMCPIMDAPINKELYTEYKGKKVYFCCPGCKERFEKEPETYLEKLPQFNQ